MGGVESWVMQQWSRLVGLAVAADPQLLYHLWLFGGVAFLFVVALFWYPWFRRLLGHRKHRGTWYREHQYAELMQMLEETAQVRVLQHEDMVALRSWKYGNTVKPLFGDRARGGYFDV